jgi:hypothetical protein
MLNPDVYTYVEEGLIRCAEVSARFQSLLEDQRLALLEQARTDGTEIITTMIRELQLPAQDTTASTAEANRSAETDGRANEHGLAGDSESATDHLLHSPSDSDSSAIVLDPGSVGLDGLDGTASGSQSAVTDDKANRRKAAIDLKVTVVDRRSLATPLSSFEPHEPLQQKPINICIPHRYALALIEAMGGTAPESPSEYAFTILKLLKTNNTRKFASDANFAKHASDEYPKGDYPTPHSGT